MWVNFDQNRYTVNIEDKNDAIAWTHVGRSTDDLQGDKTDKLSLWIWKGVSATL